MTPTTLTLREIDAGRHRLWLGDVIASMAFLLGVAVVMVCWAMHG